MRRLIAVIAFSLPLFIFALAMAETPTPAEQSMPAAGEQSAKPLVKCQTCGVEFTTIKELQEHLKAHPEHKIVPLAGESTQPLIKCSTCGVEFTTLQEVQEHLKAHPEHKLEPME